MDGASPRTILVEVGGWVETHACGQVFDEDPGKDDPMGHFTLDLGRIVRER